MPIIKRANISKEGPQQYMQPSRKGKKAWRKNVDVTEINEGLQNVREELIHGGVIAEKASEDLFTIDTSGDASISKKLLKGSKKLKADEIINMRSTIPAVCMKKRAVDRTTNGIIDKKRQRTSYVTHKELSRLRAIADGRHEKSIIEISEAIYDPWDPAIVQKENAQDPRFSFLEKKKKKVSPETLKHKPISLAASGKEIPAVSKPDGGYSYNPTAVEYVERLQAIGAREVEAEKARIAAEEVEKVKLEAAARSAKEAEAAEARADLSEWEEDSAWEGCASSTEEVKLNSKRPQRKTQAQRNRIKRRKEEERKAKMAAAIRKKNAQVNQAKALARQFEQQQKHKELNTIDDSSSSGDELELRRRKLGKILLPEKDLEIILPDELRESLRLLKPEGNLLKDRYRNLLVRGKIESRRPISFAKKAKRKTTEKWTHKDFVLH